MTNRFLTPVLLLISLLWSGCDNFKAWYAVEFRQGEVTSGIARLSAQHLSLMTSELSKKFGEPGVLTTITPDNDDKDFGKGTVLKTIENVEVVALADKKVFEDCLGKSANWRGKFVVVKATQTMHGRLTNNPENPVLPDPDGVKMTIRVKAAGAIIRSLHNAEYMELEDGEISFEVRPRLAQAQHGIMKGLRVVPTSNVRYENITMKGVKGTLHSPEVTLPFDISDSNMLMQIGAGENGDENLLSGEITAFGNKRKVPIDGQALDPGYQQQDFVQSFSCHENLKGVVKYKNVLVEEKLGPGVAGLTMLAMSKVVAKLVDDHECGMASVQVLRDTTLTGDEMDLGSSYSALPQPCTITFTNYRTEPDCFGVTHEINGEARVLSASQTLTGRMMESRKGFDKAIDTYAQKIKEGKLDEARTSKPKPVLPASRQPLVLELTADLSKLVVTEVCLDEGSVNHDAHCSKKDRNDPLIFGLHGGRVTAKLKPLMGKSIDPADALVHACAIPKVPITEAQLQLEDVTASIGKSGSEFRVYADGTYSAINGKLVGENELRGEMTVGRVKVPFKSDGKEHMPLKPDYDPLRFQESFLSCADEKFIVPMSDDECALTELGF